LQYRRDGQALPLACALTRARKSFSDHFIARFSNNPESKKLGNFFPAPDQAPPIFTLATGDFFTVA
jgi:hypothetical protein